jgi:hypothetical protein
LRASPELSRTMTSMPPPAHEQACAILEQARSPVRWVGIKMESCMGPAAGYGAAETVPSSKPRRCIAERADAS